MNLEGIHKNLFELPDRRMEIKKMRKFLPLFRNRDNFLLRFKILGLVVNLHSENTLFRFSFHLEGKLPNKTAWKF